MQTFNYTCLKSPRFDSNWCFFLVLTETDSIWVVIISRRSTQTGKCFRFDVTTAHCHLGICCCQLFPLQTLCQSTYVFAGELSSSLCELKSTSHTRTQACTQSALNIINKWYHEPLQSILKSCFLPQDNVCGFFWGSLTFWFFFYFFFLIIGNRCFLSAWILKSGVRILQ